MNLNLGGKTALITGASRGIGSEVAIRLADEGVKIIAIARTKEKINALIDSIGGGWKRTLWNNIRSINPRFYF